MEVNEGEWERRPNSNATARYSHVGGILSVWALLSAISTQCPCHAVAAPNTNVVLLSCKPRLPRLLTFHYFSASRTTMIRPYLARDSETSVR